MLIITYTTTAVYCPTCGKVNFHAISRFNLSGRQKVEITCECGTNLLVFQHQKDKIYSLKIACHMCEEYHNYSYSARELWSEQVATVFCQETGVEIGFIGPRDKVLKSINNMDKSVQEMVEELGYGEYFNNAEIMYKVLEILHKIAEKGKLFCSCGNYNLEVEVYPDRLELLCRDCGAVGVVFAETFKDLETVQQLKEIILTENTYKYIDYMNKKKRKISLKNKI